jgi:hypothetical protein
MTLNVQPGFLWNDSIWNPSMISTALWLDAADASTVTTVSGAVSQWNDKSGNGRNATQATAANRPVLSSNQLNGLPVVTFSQPSNQWLNMTLNDFQSTFIVYTDSNTLGYDTALGCLFSSGAPYHGASTSSAIFDASFTHAQTLNGQNFANGTSIGNGTTYSRPATATIFSFIATAPYTAINGMRFIGRDSGGGAERAINGLIAELVVLPGAPTTLNRQKLEGYLAHKWGLEANLPVGHPYKTTGPTP